VFLGLDASWFARGPRQESALSLSTFHQRGDLIVSAVGELDVETAADSQTREHGQELVVVVHRPTWSAGCG